MQPSVSMSSKASSPAKQKAPVHQAAAEPQPFWWVGLCELAGRNGERGLVAVQSREMTVLRYVVLAVSDNADALEAVWRDATCALIYDRGELPQGMLDEASALGIPPKDVVGAWGYALERAEYRTGKGEGESRKRVWTVVAVRTDGTKVVACGVPQDAKSGTPYFDSDFLAAWMHYERLAMVNLLSDWRVE